MWKWVHIVIEVGIVAAIAVLYACLWAETQVPAVEDVTKKQLSLSAVTNAVQGGLVAVSILLPVSAGLLVLVIDKATQRPIAQLLCHIRLACTYLFLSLVFGVWNLFRIPTMALQMDIDIAYDQQTAIFEILQLVLLIIGTSRLVFGIWCARTGAMPVTNGPRETNEKDGNRAH